MSFRPGIKLIKDVFMRRIMRLQMIFAGLLCFSLVSGQTTDPGNAKTEITELLKTGRINVWQKEPGTQNFVQLSIPNNVVVLDDRINLTFNNSTMTLSFNDEIRKGLDHIYIGEIMLFKYTPQEPAPTTRIKVREDYSKLVREIKEDQNKILEAIGVMQKHHYAILTDSLDITFKPIADKYRALVTKPAMSEEQRKFVVQANALNQQKQYERAIELYKKAIESDQTAYPEAYSNLALLSAQIKSYNAAIYYMKKYLMLVPDAKDARSAQDKIYEWELEIP